MTMMELPESSALPSGGSCSPSSEGSSRKRPIPATTSDDPPTPAKKCKSQPPVEELDAREYALPEEVVCSVSKEEMERDLEQLQQQDFSDADYSEYVDSAEVSCSETGPGGPDDEGVEEEEEAEEQYDPTNISDEAARIISMLYKGQQEPSQLEANSRYFEEEEDIPEQIPSERSGNLPSTADLESFLMSDTPFSVSSEHEEDVQEDTNEALADNFLEEIMLENADAESEVIGNGHSQDGPSPVFFARGDEEQDVTLFAPSPRFNNVIEFQEM